MSKSNEQQILSAYLIVGDDLLKAGRVLDRLKSRVAELGPIDFNMSKFRAGECEIEDVINACLTVPFASDKRLVILEGADKLVKSESEQLVDYLKQPNDMCVFAIVSEKLAKNTRLYKAIAAVGKNAVITCEAPKKKEELTGLACEIAASHRIALGRDAAEKLVAYVGEDTIRLNAELEKLALVCGEGSSVGVGDIEKNVARLTEAKPWELSDAMCERNIAKCLDILKAMPSVSPYSLIVICTNRMRDLIAARDALDAGGNAIHATALRLGKQDWMAKKIVAGAKKYSKQELRKAVYESVRCEKLMKSGKNPSDAFMDWMIAVLR
jgi:DNA polymerase-3 subunit delta